MYYLDEFVMENIPSVQSPSNEFGEDGPILMDTYGLHLDHLHNVYIAAGTLACALTIVMLTVE